MLTYPKCKVCGKYVHTLVTSASLMYGFSTCNDCKKERKNMRIIIGSEIEFGGEKFVVVDIKRQDTTQVKTLCLTAYDPTTADKEQQAKMKIGQTGETLVDMLRDAVEQAKKGNLGGGFGVGGM